MTGKKRIFSRLRGGTTGSPPLMPATMMFAADLAGAPRGTPYANPEAKTRFARSHS